MFFNDIKSFIDTAVQNDDDLTINDAGEIALYANTRSVEEVITIRDGVFQDIFPLQYHRPRRRHRVFSSVSRRNWSKSLFIEYDGVYIRKSTALYSSRKYSTLK